jgi:hypothetical protein
MSREGYKTCSSMDKNPPSASLSSSVRQQQNLAQSSSSSTSRPRRAMSLESSSSVYTHLPLHQYSQQQMNVGVVTPLLYTPSLSFAAMRTVSGGYSSDGSMMQQQHQQHQQQPPQHQFHRDSNMVNHHPYYLNPISPTPRIDEGIPLSSSSTTTTNDHIVNHNNSSRMNTCHRMTPRSRDNASTLHENNFTTLFPSTFTTKHARYSTGSMSQSTAAISQQEHEHEQQQQQYSSMTKKQRPNSYIAPRHIPDTYTSRVGSCSMVANSTRGASTAATTMNGINQHGNNSSNSNNNNSSTDDKRIQLRRQLSSGKIESLLSSCGTHPNHLSNDDGMMDVDSGHNQSHNNNNTSSITDTSQRPRSMSF